MSSKGEPVNPRYQALLQLLRTADNVWNASRRFFEKWDLSPSQFNVINLLRDSRTGMSQTELSEELITHRSNVTGLVDRLEKRGFVRRTPVASDRRAHNVVLTRRGAELLGEILPRYYQNSEQVVATLSTKRAAELINDLRVVSKNAEKIAIEPQP